MVNHTEAIKRILEAKTHPDLYDLYNPSMECQVNVAQDGGERVEGEYSGRKWHGWSDGIQTWKSFRIPYKANTEPEYTDREMTFDLEKYAEGIGMTGWDWSNRVSKWVAYDFDAIVGHADGHLKKLTNKELEAVKEAAFALPFVTVRKSTSGKGIHLYVFLHDVYTKNHTEHAALARAILGKMSALAGFDFETKVDACGGNMWVWHRKMLHSDDGLALIKGGGILYDIPKNWRDHTKVITKRRSGIVPTEVGNPDPFDALTQQRQKIAIEESHKQLMTYLEENKCQWWWDSDNQLLVTHTYDLKVAHVELGLKGVFETIAQGIESGSDHNCFCFPMKNGAWSVRRFSHGVEESPSWEQDGAGWTHCMYNTDPDLRSACRCFGGVEDPKKGFIFQNAEAAMNSLRVLGVNVNLPVHVMMRKTILREHKDGRVIMEIGKSSEDSSDGMSGWVCNKDNWTKIFSARCKIAREPDTIDFDETVRHLVTSSNEDYGWKIKSDDKWRSEPLTHIKIALKSTGFSAKETDRILGTAVMKCWQMVNRPFEPEYPGNREWNINSAQLQYPLLVEREHLHYGTWSKILEHCGAGLNKSVENNSWCKLNGLVRGYDYLKCWVASLFQYPGEPLPYLFFYGPQNSGKSIFHEALSLLITTGYTRADAALASQSGFNAELENSIICVVEETDLRNSRTAYNRIKDWVTSREVMIHAKGRTPYHIPNTTHWIHCANDIQACPVFPGDTRITMSYVDRLTPINLIPKARLIDTLKEEASAFLTEVLALELPESNDRLRIPVLDTEDKVYAQKMNQTPLEIFLADEVEQAPGYVIKFSYFYDRFKQVLDLNEAQVWSRNKVSREMPAEVTKGKAHRDNHTYLANIKWREESLFMEKWGDSISNINGLLEVKGGTN